MAKFDLHKAAGLSNVMNAVQQAKNVNVIAPMAEARALAIESLYPSGENFYSVEALDELSDSIREWGILQPLLVSEQAGGVYEIIAGNRRYEAAKIAGLERLPCIVKQQVDPLVFKIMLIHANMFRVKTDIERATEVAELKKAISALKAADKSVKGRTNELAGQLLNLSYRQVSRLDSLNKLIPEIRGLLESERLTASCAEQFAHLEESVQKEIHEALVSSGMEINRKEAARLRAEFDAKHRAMQTQSEADTKALQSQLKQAEESLQAKEQELKILNSRIQAQSQPNPRQAAEDGESPRSTKELERVKAALVTALQERKAIEDRYNELMRQAETRLAAPEAVRMLGDVKRRAHLQECLTQLRLAKQTYAAYVNSRRGAGALKPTAAEENLLGELAKNARELSRLITEE